MITALAIDGLSISRGERTLLRDFALTVTAGEAVAIAGANGSGKTSLLRAIAGLLRPDAGTIVFDGESGPLDRDQARREGLHLIGHQDGLKSGRKAGDELRFAAAWTGAREAGMAMAIDALDLAALLDFEVRALSAGQRRRVALARLVASPRPLWLLDEPMAPLDARWRQGFGDLMTAHLDLGGLIVAAVHDPLPIAARVVEIAP